MSRMHLDQGLGLSSYAISVSAVEAIILPVAMADAPRFDPIFPAHAIERCGITVVFREPLPERPFGRAVASGRRRHKKRVQAGPCSPVWNQCRRFNRQGWTSRPCGW
jgi:hypothetical protein